MRSRRHRTAILALALGLVGCGGLKPHWGNQCETMFVSFTAPPGEQIDCSRVWENLYELEEIWTFEYKFTSPPDFRKTFHATSVLLWSSEAALIARCNDPVTGWGTLYGCTTGAQIHLRASGKALFHEMLHVLSFWTGGDGEADHAGWPLNGKDAASAEYWVRSAEL
jgi:hypothetical protein